MANWTTVVSRAVRNFAIIDAEKHSDRDLLQRFASHGDQVAFAALVKRHSPMVLGVCKRLLSHAQDAEDATQAVFVLLAQKANRSSWHASIANWLYTTARKVARNARLASQRRTRREERLTPVESVSPLDQMTGRELLVVLDEELDRLPSRYREPLVLCYLEGLTRDEAATRLNLPEATLKSQLERGRKKLAEALTARGCTLSALLFLVTTGTGRASTQFIESIVAATVGTPSVSVAALIQGASMSGVLVKTNLLAFFAVSTVLVSLGLASVQPTSAQPQKSEPAKPIAKKLEESKIEMKENEPVARIGSTRFRAEQPIRYASYSADGKWVVGSAGTALYVWDAKDGTLLRKIETRLGAIINYEEGRIHSAILAIHPRKNLIACAGFKDGKSLLQIWDFERNERLVECETERPMVEALLWTPDGKYLLERSYLGEENGNTWLVARDEKLQAIHAHKIPIQHFLVAHVLLAHPNGNQAILWQSGTTLSVVEIETGAILQNISLPENDSRDIGLSADGKTLIVTGTKEICIYDFPSGKKLRELPVLREGWDKPGPLFSKDGKTVYVWDHHPMAYEVGTAKRKWKGLSPTNFGVAMAPCELSPDGKDFLFRVGNSLAILDADTGIERDIASSPQHEASIFWTPDAKTILTRSREERTFTAWDSATGKRLYHLRPGNDFKGDEWKMAPDLFFLNGGKEFLVCLEKIGSSEGAAFKDLLVFETATGRVKQRRGDELGESFRYFYPIAANEEGSQVVMQAFAVADPKELKYPTVLWDSIKMTKIREWVCSGEQQDSPRHFGPYSVFVEGSDAVALRDGFGKLLPAKLRYYSLMTGTLIRELESEFSTLVTDRVQADLLLTRGNNGGRPVTVGNITTLVKASAYAHDLWELSTGEKLRLFETPKKTEVVLGPGAKYLLRVLDESSFEIYEPFVLKKTIARINTPCLASRFEFSPDGTRLAASLADTTIAIWDTTPWVKQIDDELRKLVPQDLTPLFEDLAKDAEKGLRAVRLLSVAGDKAIALLNEKIAAKSIPDPEAIKGLIRSLDSVEFATRQKAEKQLRNLANQIESQLQDALKDNPSAEAKQRLAELIKQIESKTLSNDERREVRAVSVLKGMDSKAAKELLAKWAKGDPNAVLTKAAR